MNKNLTFQTRLKDDLFGWDAADNDSDPNPPLNVTSTYFSHGTHVAGIAGAQTTSTGGNVNGIASIGWKTSIIPVKCKADTSSDIGSLQSTIAGTEYAIHANANADAINMSRGTTINNSTLESLMNEANSKGILLVAATGNDGEYQSVSNMNHYPAAYDHVIAVDASDNLNLRATFSCYSNDTANWVAVMSPGTDVYSCLANGTNSYGYKDGTSMASPLVAGICGLMKSFCPACTPSQIESCLYFTCDSMPNENLYNSLPANSKVGYGRINAYNAISCLTDYSPVADFAPGLEFLCPGYTIQFFDESNGYITSWQWSSPDSLISFSSDSVQNPVIPVSTPFDSTFTIILIVINDSTNASDTLSQDFTVTQPSAEIIFPDTIAENCNGSSNCFLVEFINANPPFAIQYQIILV